MPARVLKLDSRDNVLIALADLNQGEQIQFDGQTYETGFERSRETQVRDRESCASAIDVIMYGVLVGAAVKPIQRGERLTTSNVQHQATDFHEKSGEYHWTPPGHFALEATHLPGISPLRWTSRHAELLDRGSAGVL